MKILIVRRMMQNMEFIKVFEGICFTFSGLNRKRISKVSFDWNTIKLMQHPSREKFGFLIFHSRNIKIFDFCEDQ